MKIFISWSGDLSHKVALVFKEWLPSVIQSVEAYVSSEDIDKGARWSSDISKALDESFFGVLCITKDNIEATWINFEAGALSKSFEKTKISPFLFGLNRAELQGPLLQFQSTVFEKDDIKKLVSSINKACEGICLDEQRLEKVFDVWWPELEEKLKALETGLASVKTEHKDKKLSKDNIIEEVLLLARNQQQLLANPENLFPPDYFRHIFKDIVADNFRPEFPDGLLEDLLDSYYMLNGTLRDCIEKSNNDSDQFVELEKALSRLSRPIKFIEKRFVTAHRKPRYIANKLIARDEN